MYIILLDSAWQIQMLPEAKPHYANSNRGHSMNIRQDHVVQAA